jgi:hypothetical protein
MALILCVDPGEHIGLACYDETGWLHWDGTMTPEQFEQWCLIGQGHYAVVVIEDYRLRHGRQMQQTGSRFMTAQVIGQAKLFARMHKAKVVIQQPNILNIAAMHAGIKIVKHYPDNVSAKLHGRYYLESIGVLRTVQQS